ncbi:MAG: metallophosphoesterase [Clostridia bacterium]|nr:metallophosphoesterase [Clostridia bacterium]
MIIILLAVIVLLALFCDSRFRLVTTEYELFYDKLPQGFDGYRVVQVSDLHMRQYGENNEKLISAIIEQKPDIIVITGDLINRSSEGLENGQAEAVRPLLEAFVGIAPCYFVSGNHEWASGELGELKAALEQTGVTYLQNDYVMLESGEDTIVLAGVEDPNGPADMISPPELVDSIRADHPDSFVLLLGHRNYWLEKYPELDVNLILCGHAHGGIWRLPFTGGIIGTERDLFPDYTSGVYNEGGYDLVVSRGLGDYVKIPRLFNNPQLVTVILRSKNL